MVIVVEKIDRGDTHRNCDRDEFWNGWSCEKLHPRPDRPDRPHRPDRDGIGPDRDRPNWPDRPIDHMVVEMVDQTDLIDHHVLLHRFQLQQHQDGRK